MTVALYALSQRSLGLIADALEANCIEPFCQVDIGLEGDARAWRIGDDGMLIQYSDYNEIRYDVVKRDIDEAYLLGRIEEIRRGQIMKRDPKDLFEDQIRDLASAVACDMVSDEDTQEILQWAQQAESILRHIANTPRLFKSLRAVVDTAG